MLHLFLQGTGQQVSPKEYIYPQDKDGYAIYGGGGHGYNHDIVLIRTNEKIVFNDKVASVCLPDSDPAPKTTCIVSGWGTLKSGSFHLIWLIQNVVVELITYLLAIYIDLRFSILTRDITIFTPLHLQFSKMPLLPSRKTDLI